MLCRRDFMRLAALSGCYSLTHPLWAAMKYRRDEVLAKFRAQASETDARVREGIERYRKTGLTILLEDAAGRPCETARVRLRQLRHAFKHGANLFMLDEIRDSAEKNELYKERFASAFNLATLPFYWKDNEPEEGKLRFSRNSPPVYRRPPPDLCLEWCEAHGIEPKAHCLNYIAEYVTPAWAKGTVAEEKRRLEKRFRELGERYAAHIPMWEVTNETLHWAAPRIGAAGFFSEPDLVEWSFKTAAKYFPRNRLVINETQLYVWDEFKGSRSAYYMQIENALLKGCRIDGVGFQAHSFWGCDMAHVVEKAGRMYDPKFLFEVLDTYARLGKPMQITEMTIPAYSVDPGDEAVQAEIVRELYRIWFAQRGMEAIVYWNLPDGYAAGARAGDFSGGENCLYGGLCRFDMSPKPAYEVIRDLFGREWRTNFDREVAGGRLSLRAFHGDYEVEVWSNGRKTKRNFSVASQTNDQTLKLVV